MDDNGMRMPPDFLTSNSDTGTEFKAKLSSFHLKANFLTES